MIQMIQQDACCEQRDMIMVGDRLDTDVLFGKKVCRVWSSHSLEQDSHHLCAVRHHDGGPAEQAHGRLRNL